MISNKKTTVVIILLMIMLISQSLAMANDTKINMSFKGADIRDVLRTIAELAEVNLVTDSSVSGDITIHLKNLSFLDALQLITQSNDLAYKWYENTVVVATPEKIDQIYADIFVKTIDVKYADLTQVQGIVTQVYPELGVTTDPRNQKLIFKGKDSVISEAESLVRKLDTEKKQDTELVPIPAEKSDFLMNYIQKVYPELVVESDGTGNFALYGSSYDIKSAKLLLNRLIEQMGKKDTQDDTFMNKNVIRSIKLKHVEVDYIQEIIKEMYPDINIVADSKNNQLIYNGPERNLAQINLLVEQIDLQKNQGKAESANNEDDGEVENIYEDSVTIKYADVEEVKTALQDISPSLSVRALAHTDQIILSGSKSDVQMAVTIAESIDNKQKQVIRIVNIDYASLTDVEGIIGELYPDITFKVNLQDKDVVLNGNADKVNEIVAMLEKIDVPRKQVVIEARFEEVSTSDLEEMGINADQVSKFEIIDKNEDGFIDGLGISFADFINLLNTDGKSKTLANPKLMAISGVEADLLIGNQIPVTVEKVEDGQVVNTIEYIDAGIQLTFTPWVTKDNKINLKVIPQVSSIGEPIGTSLPPINRRFVSTNVTLRDGQTFAIGGLIQDDIIESISKVPLLSEIPILGELFRSRKLENRKTDLIIYITPHIVDDSIDTIKKESPNTLKDSGNPKVKDKSKNEKDEVVEDNKTPVVKDNSTEKDSNKVEESKNENKASSNTSTTDKSNSDIKTSKASQTNDDSNIEEDKNIVEEKNDNATKEESEVDTKETEENSSDTSSEDSGFQFLTYEELNEILGLDKKNKEQSFISIKNKDDKEDKTGNNSKQNTAVSKEKDKQQEDKTVEDKDEDISKETTNKNNVEPSNSSDTSEELNVENSELEKDESGLVEEKQNTISEENNIGENTKVDTESNVEEEVMIDLSNYHMYKYKLPSEITMRELAEKFNVAEELINEANKNNEASVGSYLNIPVEESRIYVFKKGDTLWKIHSLYDVEISQIKQLNNISNENEISVGTEIVIP